jgi:hypothetical protein
LALKPGVTVSLHFIQYVIKKEAVVVSKTGNQCCNKKLLSRKPDIKVIRDLLTKKWIRIKANKQLGVSNLKQYQHSYTKLLSASNIKAFKQLIEVAMFQSQLGS